jgi:hypothetical protein
MSQDWISRCAETYHNRILYTESVSAFNSECLDCNSRCPKYKCQDCTHHTLLCSSCLLERHAVLPTHCFREWNGTSFTTLSTQALGYVFHLGHQGKPCNLGDTRNFTLGDSTGLHEIAVRFCHHTGHPDQVQQLLDAQVFPCSDKRPQSGFTFSVLRKFHLFATEAKLSSQRFYNVLVYLTHSFTLDKAPDRYREFMRAWRQWEHLQDLRRSGHDTVNTPRTSDGDLALCCPACPREKVNFLASDINSHNL